MLDTFHGVERSHDVGSRSMGAWQHAYPLTLLMPNSGGTAPCAGSGTSRRSSPTSPPRQAWIS